MGVQPQMPPMFVSSTYRITGLHHTYGCTILSATYLCKLYLENHWVTLHLLVSSLKCSYYTRLLGAPLKV